MGPTLTKCLKTKRLQMRHNNNTSVITTEDMATIMTDIIGEVEASCPFLFPSCLVDSEGEVMGLVEVAIRTPCSWLPCLLLQITSLERKDLVKALVVTEVMDSIAMEATVEITVEATDMGGTLEDTDTITVKEEPTVITRMDTEVLMANQVMEPTPVMGRILDMEQTLDMEQILATEQIPAMGQIPVMERTLVTATI